MTILIMGVSGCGKTTIGGRLAGALGWPFHDADDYHPPANIEKMRSGQPLTDADRLPWLHALRDIIAGHQRQGTSCVVTCSALKKAYRDILASGDPKLRLVHLCGDYEVILARMNQRDGHFMPPELLRSQFQTLEIPTSALQIPIGPEPGDIVATIRASLAV
jgi:gluconokinase